MELTNFRDLGGLVGHQGKKVKEKALLRAGQPVGLTKSDVAELRDVYGLAHIIDFRGEHEVQAQPVDTLEDVAYTNIDILAAHMKKQQKAPSLEEMLKVLKPGAADAHMTEVYGDLVSSEDAKTGFRRFIDALLAPKGASLFHCFAGKDRTGWGAAIILKILGVDEADIELDYLASIEGRQKENEKMIAEYREKGFTQEQLEAFEEMMSVKPLYLQVAFDTVKKEFGAFNTYLTEALQVTNEEIARLRALYLV